MPLIELESADNHILSVYQAEPEAAPKGAVLLVHEMYGLNVHIRDVADRYAKEGYLALAPALFDRVEPRVSLRCTPEGLEQGASIAGRVDRDKMLVDVEATLKEAQKAGKVGIIGYRFGGSVAWVAANKLSGLACAVSYYGGRVAQFMHLAPKVPMMVHVGLRDTTFPQEKIEQLSEKYPDVVVHKYDAGHGFNNDHHADFREDIAQAAFERTAAFVGQHVSRH